MADAEGVELRSLIETIKLLKIRDAQFAKNEPKAVRMYMACTQNEPIGLARPAGFDAGGLAMNVIDESVCGCRL
jgi:hypothetical protein